MSRTYYYPPKFWTCNRSPSSGCSVLYYTKVTVENRLICEVNLSFYIDLILSILCKSLAIYTALFSAPGSVFVTIDITLDIYIICYSPFLGFRFKSNIYSVFFFLSQCLLNQHLTELFLCLLSYSNNQNSLSSLLICLPSSNSSTVLFWKNKINVTHV